jgi:hypothetical protein
MTTRHYTREVDKPRNSQNPQERWSVKQKFEAVALYKLLGSLVEVSKQTLIPVQTLRQWHIKDWWKDYELELAQGARSTLTAKLERVRDRAITVVEDRLENGDFVYNTKTGEIVRKPVNASVANKIMTDTVDKSILIEKLNQEHKVAMSVEKMSDRLAVIAETFNKMVSGKSPQPRGEVLELSEVGEGVYAVPDSPEPMQAVPETESVLSEPLEQGQPEVLSPEDLPEL